MSFWDSSALVPLLVPEAGTPAVRALYDTQQQAPVVWWATLVEAESALARRWRNGQLGVVKYEEARARLLTLHAQWTEVQPGDAIRDAALRLLRSYPLRAADALQLAAALSAADGEPESLPFVCLDERFREAAAAEGLPLLPP